MTKSSSRPHARPRKETASRQEKKCVGIIGTNARYGWGSSAHIPALKALPEFEITAVCTSRQETADEAAKHSSNSGESL
jgi:predicted dehydrogenase